MQYSEPFEPSRSRGWTETNRPDARSSPSAADISAPPVLGEEITQGGTRTGEMATPDRALREDFDVVAVGFERVHDVGGVFGVVGL